MKGDICISCPTICSSCTVADICESCKAITKRINSPACDGCPDQYFLLAGSDNCQNCQIGCNVCLSATFCSQCLNGYFRDLTNSCVAQCPDGYFNNSSNAIDPQCTICNINCATCQDNANNCLSCSHLSILISSHCYICNQGQYLLGISCLNCIQGCQICTSNTCSQCLDSYYYKATTNECLGICDEQQFGNINTRTCDSCDSSCLTCSAGTNNDCLSCFPDKVLNVKNVISGSCEINCLTGFYKVNANCVKCWQGCISCIDSTKACLICALNYYRFQSNNYCYSICPAGYYNNNYGFICSVCHPSCATCNGNSANKCTSCMLPNAYYQNSCISFCPEGYGNIDAICKACTQNCKECFGTAQDQCQNCYKGVYFLNNQCYSKCPRYFRGIRPQYICKCIFEKCVICTEFEYFYNNQCFTICPAGTYGYNGLCITCDLSCSTCFGEDNNQCLTCINGLVLFENSCITQCVGSSYKNMILNECKYCSPECLACTGPTNLECTTCFDQKVLGVNRECLDNCSNDSFLILSENRCHLCHSSCLTCFGGSEKNCLTCVNYFYLNQCVSTCDVDGFKISANGIECEPITGIIILQCSYQCSTCQLTERFCTTCSANRYQNPPNCDCNDGYFDDGSNFACSLCANKCSSCTGSTVNCIKCKGDRLLPDCQCPRYYYDDLESVACIKCPDNCSTCSFFGCITCLSDRINPPNCFCPDGYYETYSTSCQQCAKKCSTCSVSEQVCDTCFGIRINSPVCYCPVGYFINSEDECQQCDSTCIDCNSFGCLSCSGNRVGPANGACPCDQNGISRFNVGSIYCTDCSIGVPFFGLNEDFTGFDIDFGGQVKLNEGPQCSSIFETDTLEQFGKEPICTSDQNVIFGQNPTIKVGDQIKLKLVYTLLGCNYEFASILQMPLQIPSTIDKTQHKPVLKFADLSSPNGCEPISLKFEQKFFNGGQKFTILSWNMITPSSEDANINAILEQNVANNSEIIVFPPRLFKSGIQYKFEVTLESFAKLQNALSISFQPIQLATIIFAPVSNSNQFFRFEAISIPSKISYYNCIQNDIPQILYYQVTLINNKWEFNGTISEGVIDQAQFDVPLNFDPFYFNFSNPYTFVFQTILLNSGQGKPRKTTFNIYIIPSNPILTIEGGNRMIGYTDDLHLNLTITDQDITSLEAKTKVYFCSWSCLDLVNNTACLDQSHQTILFDSSCNQLIKGKTFLPYQVFTFQVSIMKQNMTYTNKISVQTFELGLPTLSVIGGDQTTMHNYYDELIYQIVYTNINPDLLMYAGALIYDSVVQATFQFHYLDFKFKISNYFIEFNSKIGNQAKLRLSIYDPRYIMPSINTQVVIINIPPKNCQITSSSSKNVVEFLDIITIEIINCQSENLPLLYSLLLYENETLYEQNLIESQFYNGLLLVPPQQQNIFHIYLPYYSQEQSLLIVNIHDQFEGIVNITTKIKVNEYFNLTGDTLQSFLNRQENSDQQLIVYRILVERLARIDQLWNFKENLFKQLVAYDQNQSFLSNQTESLYHSLSIILIYNTSLLKLYESELFSQLNYRIGLASSQLQQFTDLQKKNKLTSNQNIQKSNYVKQYYAFSHILSSFNNFRVARNASSTEIQNTLSLLMNQLQEVSLANEPLYNVMSNSFNLNFGYLTSKMVGEITGSGDTTKKSLLDKQTKVQINDTFTNFYKYSLTRYIDNPFYATFGFPKNSSKYQAVDPKLLQQNLTSNETKLKIPMKFKFPISTPSAINTSLKCITTVDEANWSADLCKTVNKTGVIVCECDSLNPTSIMESLDFILDKASQVYSINTLLTFISFPFYKTIVFYFYAIITCTYLYVIYWGTKVDNAMFQKIQQEQDSAEQQLRDEQEEIQLINQPNEILKAQVIEVEQNNLYNLEPMFQLRSPTENTTIFNRNHSQLTLFRKFQNNVSQNTFSPEAPKNRYINEAINNKIKKLQLQEENQESHNIDIQEANQTPCIILTTTKQQECSSPLENQQQQDQQNEQGASQLSISKLKAYLEYLKFFHQILSIIYKDDESQPRGLRASIVYTSIMGSLAVLFIFNRPNNLSFTITLAMLTAPVNKIYQIILEKLLGHSNKSVRLGGAIFMIVTAGFISYTMLAGLVLSGSVETANKWSYIFIGTFSLDNLFYSPLQLILQYGIHLGFINLPILKQLLHKLLDKKAKEFLQDIFNRLE